MDEGLLIQMMELTEEENAVLNNKREIAKDIYTTQAHFVIESRKFLDMNKLIQLRKHVRFIDFPKHRHDYIEVNYVYNGKLKQKVGEEPIILKKGELLFLNQHIYHEIEASEEEDIVINFIIQPEFFEYIFSYLSTDNIISNFLINSLYDNTQNGQYLYFAVSEAGDIQEIMEKLIHELLHPSILSDSTIKLYTGLLMIELIKNTDKLKQKKEDPVQQYIMVEVMKYIDGYYQSASLYELADKLHLPHYGLSKQIKAATSYTFKELLQEKRLKVAKDLLEGTSLPITNIVNMVGYDNTSYFYRIFKAKFGLTPQKLRG
ncbi:AraC family transcriptional regulator [Bacillus sp. 1P06AnD]|uniref:AraC family transcriptional regulator n=1 Tax=Bacillus sp. 1P06AnD TaxID=3132208 RepID=UPI0039A2AF49